MIYNQNKVEMLRQRYPEGTRICVDSMDTIVPLKAEPAVRLSLWMMRVLSIANSTTAERLALFPMLMSSIQSNRNRQKNLPKVNRPLKRCVRSSKNA